MSILCLNRITVCGSAVYIKKNNQDSLG